MIITKPELIKLNEKSFMDSLIENLDWKTIERIVQDKINIRDIKCKSSDMVVHNDQVAYKLNLELKIDLDVIIDRDGEYVNFEGKRNTEPSEVQAEADNELVDEDLLEEVSDDELIINDEETLDGDLLVEDLGDDELEGLLNKE